MLMLIMHIHFLRLHFIDRVSYQFSDTRPHLGFQGTSRAHSSTIVIITLNLYKVGN